MAFFIAQLTRISKALSMWPTPLDLLVKGVMKNAFLPPFSLRGLALQAFFTLLVSGGVPCRTPQDGPQPWLTI